MVESTENKILLYTNAGGKTSSLSNYSIYTTVKNKVDSFTSNRSTSKTNTNSAISTVKTYLENEDLDSSSVLDDEQYNQLNSYYSEANSCYTEYTTTYGNESDLSNVSYITLAKSLLKTYEDNNLPVTASYTFDIESNTTLLNNIWKESKPNDEQTRQLSSGMFSFDVPSMDIDFSSCSLPSSGSITTCPVVSNGIITINFPNSVVNNATIKLKQYGTSSKYVTVTCYTNSGTKTFSTPYSTFSNGYMNIELTNLASNTSKIVLDCSSNSNQIGFSSITTNLTTDPKYIIKNNYYASIDSTYKGETLWSNLNSLLTSSHVYKTSYEDLKYLTALSDADPNKEGNIIDFYTNLSISAKWEGGDTWQREHVWCTSHSWWGSAPAATSIHGGTDLHHLRPEIGVINGSRSNKKYGEVSNREEKARYYSVKENSVSTSVATSDDVLYGYLDGKTVFEPIDAVKGDVARILMYLLVRYQDEHTPITNIVYTSSSTETSAYDLLLKWHTQDPVDQKEIDRNNQIYLIQGNRNPFIDNPNYANLIWENL